jgi:hypothetical protein
MSRRYLGLGYLLALSACGSGQVAESDPANIRNRADSLQKAADATTDELVNQIDAEAATETAPTANAVQ